MGSDLSVQERTWDVQRVLGEAKAETARCIGLGIGDEWSAACTTQKTQKT